MRAVKGLGSGTLLRALSLNQALVEQKLAELATQLIGTTSMFVDSFAHLYNLKLGLECLSQIVALESECLTLDPAKDAITAHLNNLALKLVADGSHNDETDVDEVEFLFGDEQPANE